MKGFFDSLLDDLDGDTLAEWQKILWDEQCARDMMIAVEAEKIAAATQRIEHAGVKGLGELRMVVHPRSYHYWGQRLGYECWEDEQFKREYRRDNECARVRNRPRKTQIVSDFESAAPADGRRRGLLDQFGRELVLGS